MLFRSFRLETLPIRVQKQVKMALAGGSRNTRSGGMGKLPGLKSVNITICERIPKRTEMIVLFLREVLTN
jgi:hypothetical protein